MFETTRDGRVPRTAADVDPVAGEAEEPGAESSPKVRLSQLAAAADAPTKPRERQEPSPRHAVPEARGVAGRLVQRWIPRGLTTTSPAARGRRLALTTTVVGMLLAGGITAFVLDGRTEPERPPSLPVARAISADPTSTSLDPARSGDAAQSHTTPGPTSLVVSVVGTVAEPGLITLSPGARVADAIARAGGAERDADLHTVNLARKLSDGEQIYVGVPMPPGMAAAGKPTGPGPGSGTLADTPVDLNSADRRGLETLPGVGVVTAQRILDWRARHGRFTAVEQLREIEGIGEKRFARLRDKVSVG